MSSRTRARTCFRLLASILPRPRVDRAGNRLIDLISRSVVLVSPLGLVRRRAGVARLPESLMSALHREVFWRPSLAKEKLRRQVPAKPRGEKGEWNCGH